jgi:hypothetical protein
VVVCGLLAGCFKCTEPIVTPEQCVLPVPAEYDGLVLWPVDQPAPAGSGFRQFRVIGGRLAWLEFDLWTGQASTDTMVDCHLAQVQGHPLVVPLDALQKGDDGCYHVDGFHRIILAAGRPVSARAFANDYLEQNLYHPFGMVRREPNKLAGLEPVQRELVQSARHHRLILETDDRVCLVRGGTAAMQAFMVDNLERVFDMPCDLMRPDPPVLAAQRIRHAAGFLANLKERLGKDDNIVGTGDRTALEVLAGLRDRLASTEQGLLTTLAAHPRVLAMPAAVDLAALVTVAGVPMAIGNRIRDAVLPQEELLSAEVVRWTMDGAGTINLSIRLAFRDPLRPERPCPALVVITFTRQQASELSIGAGGLGRLPSWNDTVAERLGKETGLHQELLAILRRTLSEL